MCYFTEITLRAFDRIHLLLEKIRQEYHIKETDNDWTKAKF